MIRALCLGWLALLPLRGCSRPVPDPATSHELVVSVPYGPASFYLDSEGNPTGYTHDLVQAFAAKNNWTVKWLQTEAYSKLIDSLRGQESHFIAANLIPASVDELRLLPGPMLFETRVVVLTRHPIPRIRNLADLAKLKIGVALGAGHISLLESAKRKYPKLQWVVLEDIFPEGLLAKLDEGEFDAVVVNEQDFDLARNQYPALRIAYELSGRCRMASKNRCWPSSTASSSKRAAMAPSNSFMNATTATSSGWSRPTPRASSIAGWQSCPASTPTSARPRSRPRSTGGCSPPSATRNPSGIPTPPPPPGCAD